MIAQDDTWRIVVGVSVLVVMFGGMITLGVFCVMMAVRMSRHGRQVPTRLRQELASIGHTYVRFRRQDIGGVGIMPTLQEVTSIDPRGQTRVWIARIQAIPPIGGNPGSISIYWDPPLQEVAAQEQALAAAPNTAVFFAADAQPLDTAPPPLPQSLPIQSAPAAPAPGPQSAQPWMLVSRDGKAMRAGGSPQYLIVGICGLVICGLLAFVGLLHGWCVGLPVFMVLSIAAIVVGITKLGSRSRPPMGRPASPAVSLPPFRPSPPPLPPPLPRQDSSEEHI
ncbi:MAG: hypothetical protein LLG01_06120 [Planctomycetaceae bacterium]|nr:hypothetical protein [Planctomycetaceae bacterium]